MTPTDPATRNLFADGMELGGRIERADIEERLEVARQQGAWRALGVVFGLLVVAGWLRERGK